MEDDDGESRGGRHRAPEAVAVAADLPVEDLPVEDLVIDGPDAAT